MFWIVTAVLGAVLLGAWFYDRRHGVDPTRMPTDARQAQAEADADATPHGRRHQRVLTSEPARGRARSRSRQGFSTAPRPRVFQRRGSDIRTCLVVVALLRVYSGLSEHVNVSQLHSTRPGHLAFGAEVTR